MLTATVTVSAPIALVVLLLLVWRGAKQQR
jgi:hypothetical protein